MTGHDSTTRKSVDTAVAIIGTGFSGLAVAIRLKQAGRDDFVVFEKADEVGGTWRVNTYPGAACDVPSHMYSFSFEPKHDWSRTFAPQAEILDYLRHCADKYDIRPHIRFNAEITGVEYDDESGVWSVHTADGTTLTAGAVVVGIGPLHVPSIPDLLGIDSFEGPTIHSAQWNHDVDLGGKKVAVVGTGASAIQIVPAIADEVDQLHLFQRTAPWVLPKLDRPFSKVEQFAFKYLPGLQRLSRARIYWQQEARILGMAVDPRIMKAAEAFAKGFIRTQISDPALREAVTPEYTMGCKRILLSNTYYGALNRSNVDVVTSGIAQVKPNSIVTSDGVEHEVDVIVYGTGFKVGDLGPLNVSGSAGVKLRDAWANGMEAYLGTSIAGFPNLFFMVGPNTGLGHNSIVFMAEAQADYVLQALRLLDERGAKTLEVRPDAQREFNAKIQAKLSAAVWSAGGCMSWYLDADGRNRTLWPGFTFTYWAATRRINPAHYVVR